MATIATLTFDLIAESSKLRTDLQKASKSTQTWANKTKSVVGTASKAFAGLAVSAAAAMAAIYVKTAQTADELGKFSDKLGEAPERMQGLQRAAQLTGVSVSTANMALQRMTRRVAEAGQGTGEAVKALKELNLDAAQLAKQSPADQFAQIADAMKGVGNQGDKVRLAMKLFDSEGVSLVNTLALGSEGLREAEKEVQDYGLALTRVDIAKIEAANDSWLKSTMVLDSFGNQLAAEIAPIVEALSNEFLNSAREAGGMGEVAIRAVRFITDAVGTAADTVLYLQRGWAGLKLVVAGVAYEIVDAMADADRAVSSFLDMLPGVEAKPSVMLENMAAALKSTYEDIGMEFQDLMFEPPPSEAIEKFVADVQSRAQIAAEKVAKNAKKNIGSTLIDPALNPKVTPIEPPAPLEDQPDPVDYTQGLQTFKETAAQYKSVAENTSLYVEDAFARAGDAMVTNFSNAAAQAIVAGKSLDEVWRSVAQTLVTSVLSSLIQIGVQMAINKAFSTSATAATVAESLVAGPAIAAAYAPAAAAVSLATLGANAVPAAAGISSTYALTSSLGVAGIAHEGMDNIPREGTWLLDKGERVIPSDENKRITEALERGTASNDPTINVTNVIQVSGGDPIAARREVAKAFPAIKAYTMQAVEQALASGGSLSRAAGVR